MNEPAADHKAKIKIMYEDLKSALLLANELSKEGDFCAPFFAGALLAIMAAPGAGYMPQLAHLLLPFVNQAEQYARQNRR